MMSDPYRVFLERIHLWGIESSHYPADADGVYKFEYGIEKPKFNGMELYLY